MAPEHRENPLVGFIRKAGIFYATLTSVATIVMMLIGTADVVGTTFFKYPVPATYELTATLMAALVFGGLSYAQTQGRHVRVELFIRRFPWRLRWVSDSFGLLVGTVFFGFLTWRCAVYFWRSWEIKEIQAGLIRFPLYPAKFLIIVGVGLMTIQLLIDLFYSLKNFKNPETTTPD